MPSSSPALRRHYQSVESAARASGQVLLFVHYNANSTGSFVDFILQLTAHVAKRNRVIFVIGGEGPFTDSIRALGIEVIVRDFHENGGFLRYAWHCATFAMQLLRLRVNLIFYCDYIYWKPAEVLSGLLLRIPSVAEIHFYKNAEDLNGFLSRMTCIAPNSAKTAETFRSAGLAERVTVMPNCVDVARYRGGRSALRDTWAAPGELLVGYVGVLHPIKGIEHFISAAIAVADRVPNARFVVVGGEKQAGWRTHLEQLARPLIERGRLSFAGHRDDVPDVMRALDILVVPSLEEPFGYVNIEAGAAGVPVVASRVGGIPEIVIDGKTGRLVPPGDSAAIAAAMDDLLRDEALRAALGEAARRHIEASFSLAARLDDWDQLFESVLTNSRAVNQRSVSRMPVPSPASLETRRES